MLAQGVIQAHPQIGRRVAPADDQSARKVERARGLPGLLQVADGALSQVTNLLNRAVTLATEVSNGTLNGSQQAAANQEYNSILSEISNIGSTTTYNQKQVFGGADVAPFFADFCCACCAGNHHPEQSA